MTRVNIGELMGLPDGVRRRKIREAEERLAELEQEIKANPRGGFGLTHSLNVQKARLSFLKEEWNLPPKPD